MATYYNEFSPALAEWLRRLIKEGHLPDGEVDERSIVDVLPSDLLGFNQCHFFAGIGGWPLALKMASWYDEIPVWTGSPPCQPFSSAGLQKGQNDERHLSPHFISLVESCRPSVLFGEQVASASVFGKTSKRTGSSTEGTLEWVWIDDLSDRLEAAHYSVGTSDLPAASIGAPHVRQRTYFGAFDTAYTIGNKQQWQESRSGETGRVGREQQPFSWDTSWQSALSRFRAVDDGLPRSVVGTDAARNAIVPPLAAEFVKAFKGCLPKEFIDE